MPESCVHNLVMCHKDHTGGNSKGFCVKCKKWVK